MASETTSLHELVFATEGLDPSLVRVRGFTVREGLSEPYALDLQIDLEGDLEPRAWILTPASVTVVRAADGAVLRRYTGVVTRVRERAGRAMRQRIGITVESPLAPLAYGADHRIFQQMTTQDIVSQILNERGIPSDSVSFRLSGSYPKREVCTQYAETALQFISRILEEDGIFYYFEHGEDGPLLVFGDGSSAYAATDPDEIPFVADSGLISEQTISAITEVSRIRPAKVTLRDHDFKRPRLDLEAKASKAAPLDREHYDYPGRYVDPAEGKRRAQMRLDALTAAAEGVRGTSNTFSLTPGHTFTLSGAPDPSLDREWVVCGVEHAWEDKGGEVRFRNGFHLLPKDLPYRPPSRTPRPIVPGPQVATVTGPQGEEIHCDEHGRIKVRFPWDRRATWDDKSSGWVRVTQMHSSGSVAIPRVGWEVLVDFEDGDPDRPYVIGRLYNGQNTPPYTLPDCKTMSSLQSKSTPKGGGHNEIRMEDKAGGEHVHVHAEKDHNLVVANNKTEKVTTNVTSAVGSNDKLTVGANETVKVGAAYQLTVGGSQSWTVGAARNKTISGDEKIAVVGSRTTTIGASHTTMTPKSVGFTTPASLTETVGGSCMEVAALGVAIATAGAASITVGGAKIEAVATGKNDITLGARASTVGGAYISASGKDVAVKVGGAKATTVGGVMAANAGKNFELSSSATLNITVGGAVAFNGASVVLKVGGSNVTLSAGSVVISASEIKLTATGPQPELAPMVADK
jgi:type VI secretion system secreted protein VgrG